MLQNGLDPGGDQLGGFDPGVLDIDQPHGNIHRLGQLCQQLDLGQLATGELQCNWTKSTPAATTAMNSELTIAMRASVTALRSG